MISEAQVPGFVPASEIPPGNLSREEELEELVRKLSADAERRSDIDNSGPARQAAGRLPAGPKPQEWQSLQIVISDLLEANKDLQATVKKQALQIEELKQKLKEQEAALAFQEKRLDKHSEYILDIKDRMDPEPQPKQKNQSEILRLLLAQNNGKMLKADARHKMGLSKSQFSDLLSTMSGLVESKPLRGDRRSHVLILIKNKELVQLNY